MGGPHPQVTQRIIFWIPSIIAYYNWLRIYKGLQWTSTGHVPPKKIAYAIIKTVSERLMAMFFPEINSETMFAYPGPQSRAHWSRKISIFWNLWNSQKISENPKKLRKSENISENRKYFRIFSDFLKNNLVFRKKVNTPPAMLGTCL